MSKEYVFCKKYHIDSVQYSELYFFHGVEYIIFCKAKAGYGNNKSRV